MHLYYYLLLTDLSEGMSDTSFGVMKFNDKFYITDSHSCDAKSATAADVKIVLLNETLLEFYRISERATGSRNLQYMINSTKVGP